jgi:hypothetical protein
MKIWRLIYAGKRKEMKERGSVPVPLPDRSPYKAVYVFEKDASRLYGAGTKWCTTSDDPTEDVEFEGFPNLVYFIHKTHTIKDDPEYYKLAIQIEFLMSSAPRIYRWDAWNLAMSQEEFLERVGLRSFDDIIRFMRNQHVMVRSEPVILEDSGQQDFSAQLGVFEPKWQRE